MRLSKQQLDRMIANGARVISTVGGGRTLLSRGNSVALPLGEPARPELPRAEVLVLTLSGLRLRSWNTLMGSGKRSGQTLAKRESREAVALAAADGLLFAVEPPVRITVRQLSNDNRRWDVGNLCHKHLIDALVDQGVLPDDNRRVVHTLTATHGYGEIAVEVEIETLMLAPREGGKD